MFVRLVYEYLDYAGSSFELSESEVGSRYITGLLPVDYRDSRSGPIYFLSCLGISRSWVLRGLRPHLGLLPVPLLFAKTAISDTPIVNRSPLRPPRRLAVV